MQSLVPFIFVLNFFGPLSAFQDDDSSICRLTDAPNQCGAFCLSALHPLMDNGHKSQMKLDRIERGVESLKNASHGQLGTLNAGIQHELQMLQTKVKKQETAIQTKMSASLQVLGNEFKSHLKPLQESLQRSITKEDIEARLNVTDGQLLVVSSELKNQLKELHTKINQTQDQNTALFESFETRLNGTEGQLRMFESKMEAQLKELQNRNENQLLELKNQQSAFQKTLLETQSDIYHKITHPKFERIGSRYFYIEHDIKKTWDEAASTCRGMGGYLAAFKTDEELTAVMPKLIKSDCCYYWTGIKKEDGKFISTASGKPATHFKWRKGEPNNSGACVVLDNGGMADFACSSKNYFICQSDNET